MHPKIAEIFGKVTSAKFKLNFGGPAGGSALERASPPIMCIFWEEHISNKHDEDNDEGSEKF